METVNTNQQPPPVQNTEPPQTPPPNPPSHSKTFIIVLGIMFFLMVAIGSYVLSTRKNQTVVQNQITASPTIPQPSQTPGETANWKTYTNIKYGYTFKYPLEWQEIHINEKTDGVGSIEKKINQHLNEYSGILMVYIINHPPKNLDEFFNFFSKNKKAPSIKVSNEKITVSGEPAYLVTNRSASKSTTDNTKVEYDVYDVLIIHKEIAFQLLYTYPSKEILLQILSTFQFSN